MHNFIFDVTASESFTLVHHLASCLIHFTGVPLGYYSHICTTKVSQSLDYFVVSVLFTGLCGTCVTTFTVCCVVVCSLPNWFLHLGKTELRTRYCDCPQFPSLSRFMQAVCSAIAVLLHYLYLVMLMWMLMEGVVLYVKLVKVFTADHKRYIAFFTIASYGK